MTPRINYFAVIIVHLIWHSQGFWCTGCHQNCFACPSPTPATNINSKASDSSPGIIVGAALGGALFGFVTSLIIFVIFCRTSSSFNSSKQNVTFLESIRNPAYEYEDNSKLKTSKDYSQASSPYTEINDEMQKTARIAPIKKYEEPAIKDSVYNHLNESDKADRSDYYDHAGPAPSMSVIEDGYRVVSMKSESNEDYHTENRQNNGNEQNDSYFTLKVQED